MKTNAAILLLLLAGCKAKTVAVDTTAVTLRHADSVAALRSIRASELERETVVETIVVRPDTLGRLQVVAHDIVKTTERKAETERTGDTARFEAKAERTDVQREKTQETQGNTPAEGKGYAAATVWGAFATLAALLALFLYASWNSRK